MESTAPLRRRPGRPRTRDKPALPAAYVGFRASHELKERLEKAATASGRSLSTEAQYRLEQALFLNRMQREWRAPALWYDVTGAAEALAAQEAERRGIEGDWSSDPQAYRAALLAALHRFLQLLPGDFDLEAESGRVLKAGIEHALASEHYRRKGPQPGEGFIEPPKPAKDEEAA